MSDPEEVDYSPFIFEYVTPRLIYLPLCFAGLTLSCTLAGLYYGCVFGRLGE